MGKAFANVVCMRELRHCAGRLSCAQFGALPKRSTRDAIVIVDEIMRRVRVCRGRTNYPAAVLVAALVDLEKAFDLLPRDKFWDSLDKLAMSRGARLTLEALHEG
eukprot:3979301-Pyramimonas_sp.AAC.1